MARVHRTLLCGAAMAVALLGVGCDDGAPAESTPECLDRQVTSTVDAECAARCDDRAYRLCAAGSWTCVCAARRPPHPDGPVDTESGCSEEAISVTSADTSWRAELTCDHMVVTGRDGVTFERPGSYPVAFSPSGNFLLFVAERQTTTTDDVRGIPYTAQLAPALYALRLSEHADMFGVRLMNQREFDHTRSERAVAWPLRGEVERGLELYWTSETAFEYRLVDRDHVDRDGLYAADLAQLAPEVQRVR